MVRLLIIMSKSEVELLENQNSWKDVQNILQVHGKIPVTPVTETPEEV
jgi:hypothetical protein